MRQVKGAQACVYESVDNRNLQKWCLQNLHKRKLAVAVDPRRRQTLPGTLVIGRNIKLLAVYQRNAAKSPDIVGNHQAANNALFTDAEPEQEQKCAP